MFLTFGPAIKISGLGKSKSNLIISLVINVLIPADGRLFSNLLVIKTFKALTNFKRRRRK